MANYNLRLIKSRRSYNITEMASLLNIDRKTCQRWLKQDSLKIIEKGVNPLLVMGTDLISFLKKRKEQRKCKLKEYEFFCVKCHRAVKARAGSKKIIKTGKKIGRDGLEQFIKTGFCEICNTGINKFLRGQKQD